MTIENKAKLFGKMAQVMGKIRMLEKTGRNQFDRYDYVTSDVIAARVGQAMAEVGLAFFPSMIEVKTEDYATKNGGNNFRTVVHMQITIACGETGATWTSDWFGEAIDRSDKSISKAAVSAVKYALLKTFLLAGGDEEDADSQSPTVESETAQNARRGTQSAQTSNRTNGNHAAPQRAPVASSEDVDSNGDIIFDREADDLDKLHRHFHALGTDLYGDQWDMVRKRNASRVSNNRTDSSKDLTADEVQALINGMKQLKQKREAA